MAKIVHFVENIRPGGGPSGYLYNLKKSLEDIDLEYVDVRSLNANDERSSLHLKDRIFHKVLLRLSRNIANLILNIKYILFPLFKGRNEFAKKVNDLCDDAEYIVLHSALEASWYLFSRYKKKRVLVMNHSPTDYSKELIDNLEDLYGFKLDGMKSRLQKVERNIYNRADGVIVPCTNSLDDYFNGDSDWLKRNVVAEVVSGVPAINNAELDGVIPEVEKFRSKHKSGIILGFFGRYNSHKGYDRFIDLAKYCLEKDEEVLFVSAGSGPLKNNFKSQLANYIDLGWRKDISRVISNTDIVILPNRFTYFDLLPLEALSLEKQVVCSYTGGNKKLIELSQGCVLGVDFDDFDLVMKTVREASKNNMSKSKIRNVFEQVYSLYAFKTGHVTLVKKLLPEGVAVK